ncbi:MAG: hypothetical protein RLZZ618_1450 [Pseudomonadota bacterium]|jgi:protease-4
MTPHDEPVFPDTLPPADLHAHPSVNATPAAAAPVAASAALVGAADAPPAWSQAFELLARDFLQERRRDRRWRLFFRFVWAGLLGLIVLGTFAASNNTAAPSTAHTALVDVRGEIASDTEASAEVVIAALRAAFDDEGAKAVVIRFNSPGGSPVQAGMVHDEILRLKRLHDKKVYAVIEESCASGAYYIAVAADEIYTDKASIVGSIGVLMDGFGFTGTLDKLGVERRLLTAGDNKGMGDPFSPLSAKHRALTQAMLDQIHQQFIEVVRLGRGKRLKETPDTFSGLYWNGEEAVRLGLADHLGSLDHVARDVVKAPEIVDYTLKENVAERLAKRFGAAVGGGAAKVMRNGVSVR